MYTIPYWICRTNHRDIEICVLVRSDIELFESEFSVRWKVAGVEPWWLWETRGLGGVRRAGG